jgi:multiple sugar transport system permease protein
VALLRVVIPVAMPGIAAAAIITFLLGWAQFLFPLILTTDLSTQPVTVIVAALNQQRVVPFTLLMACGVLAAAIPGVLALVLNRYIVQGVTAGAVK